MIRSFVCASTVFALLLAVIPAPALAVRDPGNDPGEGTHLIGFTAAPIKGGIISTTRPGKIGIVTATVPYVDEYGNLIEFQANWDTHAYVATNGSITVASGTMAIEDLRVLQESILDLKIPESERSMDDQAKVGVIGALIGWIIGQFINAEIDGVGGGEVYAASECSRTRWEGTRSAAETAARTCPSGTFTQNGMVCQRRADFEGPSDSQSCAGMTMVNCRVECH